MNLRSTGWPAVAALHACLLIVTAAVAVPPNDCPAAAELIESAQRNPSQDAFAVAQQAVALCPAFETELFLAHVFAARDADDDALAALRRARSHAGADAARLNRIDTEHAWLLARRAPPCRAIALLDIAGAAVRERGGTLPGGFIERQLKIETALTVDGLSADEIRCSLEAREEATQLYAAARGFCSTIRIDLPVHFATASHVLDAAAQAQVSALLDGLRGRVGDADVVMVIGHADPRGSSEVNHTLSRLRAKAVAQPMADRLNLPASRLRTVGLGADSPKYPGTTEEALRLNRRVDVAVVPRECLQ